MNLNNIIQITSSVYIENLINYEKKQLIYDTIDSPYIPILILKSLQEYSIVSSDGLTVKYFLYPFVVPNGIHPGLNYNMHSSGRTYSKFLDCFFKRGIYQYISVRRAMEWTKFMHKSAVDQKDLYFYSFQGGIMDVQTQDFLILLTVDKKFFDLVNKDDIKIEDINNHSSYLNLFIDKKLVTNPSYKNLYKKLKKEIIDVFFATGITISYTESIRKKLSLTTVNSSIDKLSEGSSIKLKKLFREIFEEIKNDIDNEREEKVPF